MGLIRRLRVTQRAMERAMLGVSLRDRIRNVAILRRTTYRHSSTSREAEVAMGRAHSSEKGWTGSKRGPKVLEWQPRTGKRSVGRPPTRWTLKSQVAAGSKRHRTV
ncbi:jg12168 [Pararge aegeria aegeria]|uniref:Jg12167 protein n=1 Tax=Pararge aegeria aegeria TaxID=348720 RepID=A0A8S4RS85_9NEOP|nr:jg12167 [Pararge aegeria aegeria]CAH2239749.1 jg12168 [Pararge aegeria aegeria]